MVRFDDVELDTLEDPVRDGCVRCRCRLILWAPAARSRSNAPTSNDPGPSPAGRNGDAVSRALFGRPHCGGDRVGSGRGYRGSSFGCGFRLSPDCSTAKMRCGADKRLSSTQVVRRRAGVRSRSQLQGGRVAAAHRVGATTGAEAEETGASAIGVVVVWVGWSLESRTQAPQQ